MTLDESKVPEPGDFFQEVELETGMDHGRLTRSVAVRLITKKSFAAVQVVVQKVAQHWRIVEFTPGPALEGHDGYRSYEEAVAAAKGLLLVQDAARRLAGQFPQTTVTGRMSSSNPNLQNLPRRLLRKKP